MGGVYPHPGIDYAVPIGTPVCAVARVVEKKDYIDEHSAAELTHGFCPDCMSEHYGVELSSQK